MSEEIVIRTRALRKEYRIGDAAVKALDGVDMEIKKGEFVCIAGRSGSGKSTMLNMLAGLEPPTSGEVEVLGEHMERLSETERIRFRRKNIGFVFQSYNLIKELTGMENILLPVMLDKKKPDQAYLDKVIDMLDIRDRLSHLPSALSGGQQQRISIARALANKPAILFADEPTGNLDSNTTKEVMDIIVGQARRHGMTLILVSHDRTIAEYTDTILTIKDGNIVNTEYRTPREQKETR